MMVHPYDLVSAEYYDRMRHPNSAALREYSLAALRELVAGDTVASTVVEVGVGRPVLRELTGDIGFLVGLDNSAGMLEYSASQVHSKVLGDAHRMPFADRSVAAIVASLADPYNESAFWSESRRVLRRGGVIFVTLPSREWARAVRDPADVGRTRFLVSGAWVEAPSHLLSAADLIDVCESVGLTVDRVVEMRASPRPYDWSAPHIDVLSADESVVLGVRAKAT